MRKDNLKVLGATFLSAALAFSIPIPAFADSTSENGSTATSEVTATKTTPVSATSDIWKYHNYGTWKNLNLEVNGTKYPLSKDGTIDVTFNDGDTVRLLAGDSHELATYTVVVAGDFMSFTNNSSDYWMSYSDHKVVIEQRTFGGSASQKFPAWFNVGVGYDLTAKTDDGTPISGITLSTDDAYKNYGKGVVDIDVVHPKPDSVLEDGTYIWGTNKTFKDIGEETYQGAFTATTDENGFVDTKVATTGGYLDFFDFARTYGSYSHDLVYANNGLIDFDTERYKTLASLGITTSRTPVDTDEILGDHYELDADFSETSTPNTVVLKDSFGKEIATVTTEVRCVFASGAELEDGSRFWGLEDLDVITEDDGNGYVWTDLERRMSLVSKTIVVDMAEGVTDWDVSVEFEDDTFHIAATKSNTYTVDLSSGDTVISSEAFHALLEENKTKDVVIKSNDGVTFTFEKGTMTAVEGKDSYDFGTTLSHTYTADFPSYITQDNFVFRIDYNYSGKLPAKANIRIYAGTQYAGWTLYYYLWNDDKTFDEVQTVIVDKDGYVTVKQDHCSNYLLTSEELKALDDSTTDNVSTEDKAANTDKVSTEDKVPNTGNSSMLFVYILMAAASLGIIVSIMNAKAFKNR